VERVVLNALAMVAEKLSGLIFAPSAMTYWHRLQRSRSTFCGGLPLFQFFAYFGEGVRREFQVFARH